MQRSISRMSAAITNNSMSIIGAPFRGGQPRDGVDLAPTRIREARLIEAVQGLHWNVHDAGDIKIPSKDPADEPYLLVKNPSWTGRVNKVLADAVGAEAQKGNFVLTLGGDHSIAVGTIAGMARQYENIGVLWVDAHADINTSGSTPSGNLHGMPMSFLLGLTDPVPGFDWLDMDNPVLQRDQAVYVGLRDLQQEEKDYLKSNHIKVFDMHDIDKHGIGYVMETAGRILADRPIHISFDIDALDPREAPSTGTPVRGGLTFREGAYICEWAHQTGALVSMDMVEINPKLGSIQDVDYTTSTGISMIKAALGESLT